jgi:hypothetical protein
MEQNKNFSDDSTFHSFFQGILKGGSIIVPLTSCLTGLVLSVLQIKTKIVSYAADSKPVKLGVNGTVILPPFSIPCFYSSKGTTHLSVKLT